MIDFRVDMIRSAGKYDSTFIVFVKPLQNFFTLISDVLLVMLKFGKSLFRSVVNFCFCKAVIVQRFHHLTFKRRLVGKIDKRIQEVNIALTHNVHIVVDNLRIRCYHRTVEVIACVRIFYLLIRNTRVKNRFYALVDKVLNVTVYKFCRVASTFTRYRVDTFFVKVVRTSAGNSYGETKLSKECKP